MYKLVVVHPFGDYVRGQHITDPAEVAKHTRDRERHFVRVALTDADKAELQLAADRAAMAADEAKAAQ